MSAATVMRLVPEQDVPRALGMLNGGNALATTVAAPLGSFLGQYIGWRGAFFCVVPLAALTLAWQFVEPAVDAARARAAAPATSSGSCAGRRCRSGCWRSRSSSWGSSPCSPTCGRSWRRSRGVSVSTLSLMLLVVGVAGLLGTYLIGALLAAASTAC